MWISACVYIYVLNAGVQYKYLKHYKIKWYISGVTFS